MQKNASPKVTLDIAAGQLKGEKFPFAERTTCIIGRGLECNIRLPDDEAHSTVSRHHCLLDINPPDIRIRDLGSMNGTKLNDEPLEPNTDYRLTPGDQITAGRVVLIFQPASSS